MVAYGRKPSNQTAPVLLFASITIDRDYNELSPSTTLSAIPHAMIEYLANKDLIKRAAQCIRQLIDEHEEWFYSQANDNASSPLRSNEIQLRATQKRLKLECVTDRGIVIWRVLGWEWNGEKLLLEARPMKGDEQAMLEFIPRASASAIAELVSESRRVRCFRLAQLACGIRRGMRIARIELSAGMRSGQPGRDARIILEFRNQSIAVAGTVAEDEAPNVDAFISSALVWFLRINEKSKRLHVRRLWLVARHERLELLSQRVALLRGELRRVISLYEIDDEWQELVLVPQITREELFREKPRRLMRPSSAEGTETAVQIVALAPDAIDIVRSRQGETLRFHGLAFARVRRLMNRERVWFGIEGVDRRLLDDNSSADWEMLLRELIEHRYAMTDDRRHALYRAAPEAWLESLLRRDISKLDPGLRLAPIHAQFRSLPASSGGARPVDLLALRHDGRLAVIELKVSEDRQHVMQGADYWRRVEAQRRCGNIQRARLFDDAGIADEPPLVYLAAPLLSFHRAFQTLAHAIAPDIKIYRFDLNEDWRAGVRVARRSEINQSYQYKSEV